MNVTLSKERNTDMRWIFIGTSFTVVFIAIAAATGIIHFGSKRYKGNTNLLLILVIFTSQLGLIKKVEGVAENKNVRLETSGRHRFILLFSLFFFFHKVTSFIC